MPQPLRKYNYYDRNSAALNYYSTAYGAPYYKPNPYNRPAAPFKNPKKTGPVYIKRPKAKKNPILALLQILISLSFLAAVSYYVLPYNHAFHFSPMFLNRVLNKDLKIDAKQYVSPTLKYTSNSTLFGEKIFTPTRTKRAEMAPLTPSSRMGILEDNLKNLMGQYPKLNPSIYVWDFTTSRSAEINSHAVYSSASIIKLPILIELFRKSESLKAAGEEPVDLKKKLLFDEIHRTTGSGNLQYYAAGNYYTIDHLAKIMIQSSDNSATNMLLEEIGGMEALNSASRKWGLPSTQISNWLPDLKGTNTVSAIDMATLLYNIDNPKFLNDNSRYMIKQYMSNVHNTTLLKAGLPKEADIIHKTGDIGTMLGDAGIIYAPNGRKYIAVILVERPFNDYTARDFIQEASRIIYNSITNGEN